MGQVTCTGAGHRLAGSDWFHNLPLVLLGLRSVPRKDSLISPSETVLGSKMVLLCSSWIALSISEESNRKRILLLLRHLQFHHKFLQVCPDQLMFLSEKMLPNLFCLQSTKVRTWCFLELQNIFLSRLFPRLILSMDRLIPVLSEFPVTDYEPPRRGRPPVAQRPQYPMPPTPSLHTPLSKARSLKKRVRFLLQSSARRNP